MNRKIVKHELVRIDEGIKIFRVELDCGHVYEFATFVEEVTAIGANWTVAFCNKCSIGDLVSALYMVAK